jgi:hypothetical protein
LVLFGALRAKKRTTKEDEVPLRTITSCHLVILSSCHLVTEPEVQHDQPLSFRH